MVSREEKYQGKFFSVHVDQVRLPNGNLAAREVVEHVDGVAILPLDERNNVLTVTQYRYVFGKPLLEIPAGKLEPRRGPGGRRPAGAAGGDRRRAGRLPAPGAHPALPRLYSEVLYLFLARGLRVGEQSPDPDEFLHLERIPSGDGAPLPHRGDRGRQDRGRRAQGKVQLNL